MTEGKELEAKWSGWHEAFHAIYAQCARFNDAIPRCVTEAHSRGSPSALNLKSTQKDSPGREARVGTPEPVGAPPPPASTGSGEAISHWCSECRWLVSCGHKHAPGCSKGETT